MSTKLPLRDRRHSTKTIERAMRNCTETMQAMRVRFGRRSHKKLARSGDDIYVVCKKDEYPACGGTGSDVLS